MLVRFDTTTTFENPVPFFNPPTQRVPAQAAQRLLTRIDRHGGQQHPAQRLGTLGRMGFNKEQGVEFNRRQMSGLRCGGGGPRGFSPAALYTGFSSREGNLGGAA